MKRFTIYLLVIFLSVSASAQITFNWESQLVTTEGSNLKSMNVVNDTTTLLIGYDHTFLLSKDEGTTWKTVPIIDPEFDFGDMGMNSHGIGYILAGDQKIMDNPGTSSEIDVYTDGVLLYTEDFGATWTHYDVTEIGNETDPAVDPNAPGCYGRHFYSVEVLEDSAVYLGMAWYHYESADAPKVSHNATLKFSDGTWTTLTDINKYASAIESLDTTVYFGGSNHLYYESPSLGVVDIYSALTTAAADETVYMFDFYIAAQDEVYVVTSTNGIYYTADNGATFKKFDNGPGGGSDLIKIDQNTIMVIGSDTKSMLTTDGGATWIDCKLGDGISGWDFGGIMNDSVIALAKGDIYKMAVADAKAGNIVWKKQAINDNENIHQMHIIDANTALLVGYSETLKETSDAGLTWTDMDVPDLWAGDVQYDFSCISTKGTDSWAVSNRIYTVDFPSSAGVSDVFGHGLILYSPDYWETWQMIDFASVGTGEDPAKNPNLEGCYGMSPTQIECIDANTAFIYATWIDSTAGYENKTTHSGVFRTMDAGASWEVITEDLGSAYMNDIEFIDANTGFIVGSSTFYKTTDQGETLVDMFPNLIACPDAPDDDKIYINDIEYIDENEWYIVGSVDYVYATYDGGANYGRLGSIGGGAGLYKHNDSTLVILGSTSKTKISWDYGANWTDCSVSESFWGVGGVLQDSLVGLAKGEIYKIALTELDARSTEAEILTFSIPEQTVAATIDSENHTVVIPVPTGTDVTALVPTITISEGATISPETDVAQDFTNSVTYTVTAEDTETSIDWVVSIAVGIDDKEISSISMYPNPAKNRLYLTNIDAIDYVDVYSISGSLMFSVETPTDQAEIEVDVLESGFYFVNFSNEEGVVRTMKFVKE